VRSEEAELLARMTLRHLPESAQAIALDLACGPGTFLRGFARHVKFILGLDLTLALLEQAREASRRAGLANTAFACADATALPLPEASLDLAACGYSLHHFADPSRALGELARVVRPGGCAALVDIVSPDEDARAEANNRIERARDASHVRTLRPTELRAQVESAGLRVREWERKVRLRSFNEWMLVAGWEPGDPAYIETRRLMETSMAGDTAGFRPRFLAAEGAPQADIEWLQTSLLMVAERV
jgi:ubiquinone/menaquinone biosynthesis C-methylase UbiE